MTLQEKYDITRVRFIKAEDRWLKMMSHWLDDHKVAYTAEQEAVRTRIDRNVRFLAQDLRAAGRALGGDAWKDAIDLVGKNFGHSSDRS
jgi:hypothetical protein